MKSTLGTVVDLLEQFEKQQYLCVLFVCFFRLVVGQVFPELDADDVDDAVELRKKMFDVDEVGQMFSKLGVADDVDDEF